MKTSIRENVHHQVGKIIYSNKIFYFTAKIFYSYRRFTDGRRNVDVSRKLLVVKQEILFEHK